MDTLKNSKINQLLLLAVTVLLVIIGIYNYLLFHSIIEILSIVVAGLIFLLTFSSKSVIDNSFILILGVSCFFIGIFDMLHTFSYSGLNVFPGAGTNLPTQLWLVARFMQSLSILTALFLLPFRLKFQNIFYTYLVLTVILVLSIFYSDIFPLAYIEGQGLTSFKIYSEYFISSVLIASLFLLYSKRKEFNVTVYRYLNYSIAATILSEMVFTLYISVFSGWNVFGHFLKLIAFYYIYKSVAEVGIQEPQKLLFRNLKKSEERLAKSEKKYKDLFDNMNSGFALHKMIFDKDGQAENYQFVEVNKSFRNLTGLMDVDLIGKKVTEVIPNIKEDKTDWIGLYGQVVLTGNVLKIDQYSEVLDKWYSINAYCPQPGFFATVIEDISIRKTMEKELLNHANRLEEMTNELFKFQLAVEDASEAIVITDTQGVIIYANKATELMTGYSDKEIWGGTSCMWGNTLPPESRYCNCSGSCIWECLPNRNNRFSGEVINRHKNGKQFYSHLTISPVVNKQNEVLYFVCIERDISKFKEVEKSKTDFVYFVSHELKTPLASIILSVDLLFRGAAGKISEEQIEYLDTIRNSGWEMSEFIEAMLNVSRIESNTLFLDINPMDVGIEIRSLVEDLKMEIKNKDLSLKYDFMSPIPILNLDEKIFKLIVRNLLTNAIHYSPEKGEINLGVKRVDNSLEISVSDNGCGIPEKDQDKIFNKLFRSSNATKSKVKGSGLGLYIVKNMVEKIGAQIYFESKENQGSKFYLRLPLPPKSIGK